MVFEKTKRNEVNSDHNLGFIDDEVKFPSVNGDCENERREPKEEQYKSSFFALYKYSNTSDKLLYILGVLCAIITGLLTPLNSLIFGNLADEMVVYGNQIKNGEEADQEGFLGAVRRFALYNTLIGVVMLICSYLAVTCFNYAAQNQVFIIRSKFFLSVLHQDISWYDKNQSVEFASRMNEDLKKNGRRFGREGWLLALACCSSLPVTLVSFGMVSCVTSKLSKQELDVYAKAGNIAEETFTAIRTVKAFEGQDLECERYERQLIHAKNVNIKRGIFSAVGFGILWFFIYAFYGLAFWYGVKLILGEIGKPEDEIVYTPGTMITVFFSIMMGSTSIAMASPYIEALGVAKGASVKVFKLIEQIPTINPLNRKGKFTDKEFKSIEFKDIQFSYPTREEVQVLNGINIKIQKGETVALVGSSGCGKSTCIQLLQRFYDPDSGEILFNGDNLKDLDVEWVMILWWEKEELSSQEMKPLRLWTRIVKLKFKQFLRRQVKAIIVAHRLSTIRQADRIIVLNKGRIVESGTHDDLMELRKEYYNLVMTQLGDLDDFNNNPENTTKDKQLFEYRINDKTEILEQDEECVQTKVEDLEEDDIKDISLMHIIKMNKTEWPFILTGSLASIIMGFSSPLFAIIFGNILEALSDEDIDIVTSKSNTYSFYFGLTGVIVGVATFLTIFCFTIAGELLTKRLRGLAFRAMLRQELGWFDDKANGTGSLCARLSGDAAAVQGATGQRIGTIIQSLATLVLSLGLSMFYQWKLGFVALSFTPFILIATYLQAKVMEQENMGTKKSLESCTKLAVEVVSNVRTVVSLGRETMFHTQYVELLAPSITQAKKNTHYRGVVYGLAESVMYFAYATCMFYGGQLVVNTGLPYGDVFKVSQALIMGTMSIANTLAFAPNFQKGVQAAKYMFALFNRQPRVQDPSPYQITQKKSWKSNGNVTFQENMNVYEGQTVALVGPSGCGKSTCIQLLQRFYDPYRGIVAVDESDVKSVTQKTLRQQLGIVSQEPALFDRTISENIAYGDNSREVGQDEIIEAAKKANIHNFIASLPLGYETRLGERGTQLSGGQKQRVAIARALLRNPKILLLDEATSALDAESEKVVQEALETAMVGRTSLTIAHRLSTIIDSDVILVFDAGKIVEKGTHKELLAIRGAYYNLYRLQVGTN
ncbi:pgp-2.2 family protein [Megaselia abdita]